MKAAGLFMLFAGFAIVMSAFVLLPVASPRSLFVTAGIVIQLVGLFLAFRAHYTLGGSH
jgi:protein-S-isoprenylcysteine O-methyltransferase Ste14